MTTAEFQQSDLAVTMQAITAQKVKSIVVRRDQKPSSNSCSVIKVISWVSCTDMVYENKPLP